MNTFDLADFEIKENNNLTIITNKKSKGSVISFVGIELLGKKTIISMSITKKDPLFHQMLLFTIMKIQNIPKKMMENTNAISGDYNKIERKFSFISTHGNNKRFFNQIRLFFNKANLKVKKRSNIPKIKIQKIKIK